MKPQIRLSRSRTVSVALIATILVTSLPQGLLAVQSRADGPRSPRVEVNRTRPVVSPPPAFPTFSAEPTEAEISRARVFGEPLVPVGGSPSTAENAALARALTAYIGAGGRDAVSPLTAFINDNLLSPWRPPLLMNLGLVYRRTGHFSRALEAWRLAWSLSKDATGSRERAVADGAIGELFELNARLGRFEVLEQLFEEIEGRDVRGSATEKISGARQALWLMQNEPGRSFRCGPLAVDQILRASNPNYVTPQAIEMCVSTQRGTSMAQMRELSESVDAPMQIGFRTSGSAVLVPSMVHWRVGHFAALIEQNGDQILMRDPTFGEEIWVSVATLNEEASGYFLVQPGTLPVGWRHADDREAAEVWGKGQVSGIDADDDNPGPEEPCTTDPRGMASVSIQQLLVGVKVRDIPLWYTPPVGPAVEARITYSQREAAQPQIFSYSNLGSKWTFDWLSYVEDDPSNPSASVSIYKRGGGRETSTGYDSLTHSYQPNSRSQAVVTRISSSPIAYERQLPDGSVEVFEQPDGAASFPRNVFMTELRDPHGNALSFTFDATLRLVAVTDAIGQVTTLDYEVDEDPLKITKITDPFGRTATFNYVDDRLEHITDLLGLTSSFTYGTSDALVSAVTPYGVTSITTGEWGLRRWAEVTDPLGGKNRVEFGPRRLPAEPSSTRPTGMLTGTLVDHYASLVWDKRAMALGPADPAFATEYVWAEINNGAHLNTAVPAMIKRPLENRVYHNYQGTTVFGREGTLRKVTAVGRVLDDGTSQVLTYEYNSRGLMTKAVDPLGRETIYEYDSTGLDLLIVKQKNGGSYETVETRTYNSQHLPLTVTDAAGRTTTLTYNAAGSVLTVTNALSDATTFSYNSSGYLTGVNGPVSGASTTLTYDGYGRVRTVTNADSYTVTRDYDVAGRLTKATYPNGTYDEIVYNRLDAEQWRDRLGHWTRATYDAARRVTAVRDPLGRTVTQEWCACGSLASLTDANGNQTEWERDAQSRVTREVRADGGATQYLYESTTSRLKQVTDAKNQVTTYSYFNDDQLQQTTYTNEGIATPDVSLTYEPAYGRPATMVDGLGTTSYAYHPVGQLGALAVASIDGPFTNDTLTYTYDALGRVAARALHAVGVTWAYDALGRLESEVNPLGTFAYAYDGVSPRVATATYPNGQTSVYTYFGNTVDRRLQTIHHKTPGAATLSKFDYTYDAVGNIVTWRQQADTAAVTWAYGYDAADQLVSAIKRDTDPQQTVLKRYGYAYDPTSNRTAEQIDDVLVGATHNTVNELVTHTAAGGMLFAGTVNEAATVTVSTIAAEVLADQQFRATVPVASGTNTVTVAARDANGNVATKQYQVDSTGGTKTFAYDANGNLTGDGTRAFEWDAVNRLVAVTIGTHRSEFTYDGLSRRVRVVEKENGGTVRDAQLLWDGTDIIEERLTTGEVNRFFADGEQHNGAARHLTRDHLGSVREVTNSTGAVVTRNDYDPYGRTTRVAGSEDSRFSYTGHLAHGPSGLALALYRAYDPALGRWVSEDPMGHIDGPNLFGYVSNRPIDLVDPTGLWSLLFGGGVSAAAVTGAEVSGGIAINGTDGVGLFGSVGASVGLNISADVFVGFITGGLDNVRGPTYNVNVVAGLLSVTLLFDSDGNLVGGTVGVGPTALNVGGSVSSSNTGVKNIVTGGGRGPTAGPQGGSASAGGGRGAGGGSGPGAGGGGPNGGGRGSGGRGRQANGERCR